MGQFKSYPVLGVFESASSVAARRKPVLPDDRDDRVTAPDRLIDDFLKVGAGFQAVEILEHVGLPEPVNESVVQPPRVPGGIVAAVVDEDGGHDVFADAHGLGRIQ